MSGEAVEKVIINQASRPRLKDLKHDEQSNEWFLNHECLCKYLLHKRRACILVEKQIDIFPCDDSSLLKLFPSALWGNLLMGVGNPYSLPTRVFYSNIHEVNENIPSFSTIVKGKKFEVTPSLIKIVCNITSSKQDIVKHDCISSLSPDILASDFMKNVTSIISSNIIPTVSSSMFLDKDLADKIHLIVSGRFIDVSSLIIHHMIETSRKPNRTLCFPKLIGKLCKAVGIFLPPFEPQEEEPIPISIYSLNKTTHQLGKRKETPIEAWISDKPTIGMESAFVSIHKKKPKLSVRSMIKQVLSQQVKLQQNVSDIVTGFKTVLTSQGIPIPAKLDTLENSFVFHSEDDSSSSFD